jgi:hypothetical protein
VLLLIPEEPLLLFGAVELPLAAPVVLPEVAEPVLAAVFNRA